MFLCLCSLITWGILIGLPCFWSWRCMRGARKSASREEHNLKYSGAKVNFWEDLTEHLCKPLLTGWACYIIKHHIWPVNLQRRLYIFQPHAQSCSLFHSYFRHVGMKAAVRRFKAVCGRLLTHFLFQLLLKPGVTHFYRKARGTVTVAISTFIVRVERIWATSQWFAPDLSIIVYVVALQEWSGRVRRLLKTPHQHAVGHKCGIRMHVHTFDTSQDHKRLWVYLWTTCHGWGGGADTGGLVNDQPGRFSVGVAERIDRSKEHVRHVHMHSNNSLIKKQMVQENVHFGPLIGTIVFSRQNLFSAFWKMGGIKPCPLNFHSHQASGAEWWLHLTKGERERDHSEPLLSGDCSDV